MNNFSLDQLRFFVVTAEEGSFAAASKKLFRVQSAISYGISKLEADLEVPLFLREAKGLSLTPEGKILIDKARILLQQSEILAQRAKELKYGEETLLSISIDNLIGMDIITRLCGEFHSKYPKASLEMHNENLGKNISLLLSDEVQIALTSLQVSDHPDITRIPIGQITLCPAIHVEHPLAQIAAPSDEELQQYLQIIIRDRSTRTDGKDFSVISTQRWRVSDMHSKLSLIKKGLGWGTIPCTLMRREEALGNLTRIAPQSWSNVSLQIPMFALHKRSNPPGKIAQDCIQWITDALSVETELCQG